MADAALSPRNWLGEFRAFSYSARGAADVACLLECQTAADKGRDIIGHQPQRLVVIGERAIQFTPVAMGVAARRNGSGLCESSRIAWS